MYTSTSQYYSNSSFIKNSRDLITKALLPLQPAIYSLVAWLFLSSVTAAIAGFMVGIIGTSIYFVLLTCKTQPVKQVDKACLRRFTPLNRTIPALFVAFIVFTSVLLGINYYFNSLWL
ncbi:MAG TPA: hypothetical protein EYH35_00665 [Thiotrichaceae bacterium]|nr:hypothetical protein [Thiotrichaceae bacterium]